jgi:hypothetical protein
LTDEERRLLKKKELQEAAQKQAIEKLLKRKQELEEQTKMVCQLRISFN